MPEKEMVNSEKGEFHARATTMSLDDWLCSDSAPPDCMQISELDGFLTGIAVGPGKIPFDEWMLEIWGGEEPEFGNANQERAVILTIIGRYNEIVRQISDGTIEPILLRFAETGEVIAADWAHGFTRSIALRPRRWTKMMKSEAGLLLAPIMVLCDMDWVLDETDLEFDDLEQVEEEAIEFLPATILAIADYWKMPVAERDEAAAGVKTALKIGRNDPCPCGSGKKFKKCCGAGS